MANYTIDVNFNQSGSNSNTDNFSIPSIGDIASKPFDVVTMALSKSVGAFAAVGLAKEIAAVVGEVFQWSVSLVGRETGSQIAQDKANAIMSIGRAVLNPLKFGINSLFEREQAMYDNRMERINLNLLSERAGAGLNRSRREG